MKNVYSFAGLLGLFMLVFASSCALTLPSYKKTSQSSNVNVSSTESQVEALRRDDYKVLQQTTGKASTSKVFILFLPIGKFKSESELYEDAYFDAVDNLPGADGLLLPRKKSRKLIVPLLLVNYYRKKVVVKGVGIAVNGKSEAPAKPEADKKAKN